MKIAYHNIILFIISVGITFFFYGEILLSPNSFVFSSKGDGLKNYYSVAYHVKHDTSYSHFGGMNYPYGENVFFTDGQPVLSSVLKLASSFFPNISNYSIGIMNWLMIISMIIAIYFIYLILIFYQIPPWYSILYSVGIGLLAPQLFRLEGHYALSYSCFFPISWYILLRVIKSNYSYKWLGVLFTNNLIWFFIHPYLGLIIAVFIFTFWIVKLLNNWAELIKNKSHFLFLFFSVLLPILVFQVFVLLTDHHINRTNSPYGFFVYFAEFETIFFPHYRPFRPLLESFFEFANIPFPEQTWEGWAYVGLSSILIIITFCFHFLYNKIKRIPFFSSSQLFPNKNLPYFLATSILVVLFSMCYPFKLGLENLVNYIPFLKQFRALGRFAWVFYYIITVIGAVYIYNTIKMYISPLLLKYTIAIIFPALIIYEALPHHIETSKHITSSKNIFIDNKLPPYLSNELIKQYQAIIPLPFYHIGSESIGRLPSDLSLRLSQQVSFATGIPLVSSALSRTSISETKNIFQIFNPFADKKSVLDQFNEKPLLVLFTHEILSKHESALLEKSTLVKQFNSFSLYEIAPHLLSARKNVYPIYNEIKDSLTLRSGFFISDSSLSFSYLPLYNNDSNYLFSKKKAYTKMKKDYTSIATIDLSLFKDSILDLSFWFYSKGETQPNSTIIISEWTKDNVLNSSKVDNTNRSFIINNDWSLYETQLKLEKKSNKLDIVITGSSLSQDTVYVNNLLLKSHLLNVYKEFDNFLVMNNHIIVKKSSSK